MIAEINWGNFEAKFSDGKQAAFERLCYLLFCKEFNKNIGVFRFQNHAGIETNPIRDGTRVIGWQAKFYDTNLSSHTSDFIESIDTTKTRHPDVDKIIFYTNQEFGQHKKKTDPQYKTRVENHAKSKGVEVEWRTGSFFQSPFVCETNFSIAQHFFSLKKGILDSTIEMSCSTEAVLKPIRCDIFFSGKKIKLDRSSVVLSLKEMASDSPVVILSGVGGVGKTAVIKELYESVRETAPFFVFKATQFRTLSHINQLFKDYGEITAQEFRNEYNDISPKYVVIDSAEKLSEIEDQSVISSFLSDLLKDGWSVIFTVRRSYLDNLRFQLKDFYGVGFESLDIPLLLREELEEIASDNDFKLPRNERLIALLATPLYLNEYLRDCADLREDISYADFREIVWRKHIQDFSHQASNTHRRREECFLQVARRRANDGGFFVKTGDCDQEALKKLEDDEIIQHDANVGGYFITHDVYEEWALDKLIERAFITAKDYQSFYLEIGDSLPIRRAFRHWLSDKLFADDENAKRLIESTIKDPGVAHHWKDEVLVSVLLSDYSSVFFEHFEQQLLEEPPRVDSQESSSKTVKQVTVNYKYEESLLHKILFLLRIACKTMNEEFLHRLGIKNAGAIPAITLFTIPKGSGWNSTLAFINKHRDKLRFRHINAVLPVLDDWNQSRRSGETKRNASQIALFYYEELTKQEGFYFSDRDDTKDKLFRTILNGSGEIKTELTHIINKIIAEKQTSHREPHYKLARTILSSITESAEISKHLPKEVVRLAELFWFYTPPEDNHGPFPHYRNDIEQYFDLSEDHFEYSPASAFQTPTFMLLQTDPKTTVDFILALTNRSIQYFSKTEMGQREVEELDVVVDDSGPTVKQYICYRIWNIYRGTQVAPPLLESVHMALEKWLLINAKTTAPEVLENWCFYLMKHSDSASITAVVTSVVLAQPSKLFNVAKVLFRTKDLFFFDTARMQLDQTAKSLYAIAHDPSRVFQNERFETCDDKHRSSCLESLALQYQLFATEGEKEEVAEQRQQVIWNIFDDYYKQLPETSKETDADKTWRLCLARMDRRKMNIATEKKDGHILLSFKSEIDPELRQYSEDSQAKYTESMKYIPLKLWSYNKFQGNEGTTQYPQYESDPALAIAESRAVVAALKDDRSEEHNFTLFYHSLPPYVCAVLVRDYVDKLSDKDKAFCKNVLIERAMAPLGPNYQYQVGDGVEAAIGTLPTLSKLFPEDAIEVKTILLFTLFNSHPTGMGQHLSDYAVSAILNGLWKTSPRDANSLFLGFLILKPAYDELGEEMRNERIRRHTYSFSEHELLDALAEKHRVEIDKVLANEVVYSDIRGLNQIDPDTLVIAFRLLPADTVDDTHRSFLNDIFSIFSTKLVEDRHRPGSEDELDYATKRRFLEKLAYVVLSSAIDHIEAYLKPFLIDFKASENEAEFFREFISAEDRLQQYEQFWAVWKLFYPKVAPLAKHKGSRYYSNDVIRSYLLAQNSWREDAKEWHSLRDSEKQFFQTAAEEMGGNVSVLYSISKLLNGIGSGFKDAGILWISDILTNNPDLSKEELEVNTVYYLETLVRSYILAARHKIKTTLQLKNRILIILDFLLGRGSVVAYMLREDLL